jgi:hypothetical protein
MHTRAGAQHTATTRGAAHEQLRDALGGFGPGQPCLPTHALCAGRRQAEQETAVALRRRTRRRLPGGHEPVQWEVDTGAARHIERKHVLQQSCPAPAGRYRTVLLFLYALLARCGDNRPTQVAVRCQTATIAHQVDARQGHQGHQLLQEFHRRESNPRGAIGPRMGEGIDEIAVGIFLETLQGHRAAGSITDQACQLIAPGPGCWRAGETRGRWHSGDL